MRNTKLLFALVLPVLLVAGCKSDPVKVRDKSHASAQKYLDDERYEEAVIEFRNALRADKGHIPSYLGIGKAFQHLGDHDNAVAAFRQAISLDDNNVEARLRIGDYYIASGAANPEGFKLAQETAEEILRIDPSNVDGTILLGNAYSGQNAMDKAMQEYKKALSMDPGNLRASLNLAAGQARNQNPQGAEELFRSTLELHPESIEAHLALAAFYVSQNRLPDAQNYLEKAFELDPANPGSLYSLVNFHLSQKNTAEAETVFKEAIARKPREREPLLGLARFLLAQGQVDTSVETLGRLLKMHPDDVPAQLLLADISLSREDESGAEQYVKSVLKSNPNNAQAHYLRGIILRKRGEHDRALEAFDNTLRLNANLDPPYMEKAYLEKANIQLLAGDLDACGATLEAALEAGRKRNHNYLRVRGALAKLLVTRQNPKEALEQARNVLEQMPANEDALWAQAEALRLLGRLEESRSDWLRLCEIDPGNHIYRYHLGMVDAMKNDFNSALENFRKAVALEPDFVRAIRDIVYIHLQGNQYDAALAELDRLAREQSPKDEIHLLRGQVLMTANDPASAEKEWKEAIEANPQNYQAYILLGQLYQQQGKIPQALREVDQLLDRNDRLVPAYLQKAYYLQLSNDNRGAMDNYRKALELDPKNAVAANNLAWLLADSGTNLEEALSLAKEAKKLRPEDPEIADTLGWTYYKMKNYTLAADQLLYSVNNRKQPQAGHYYRLGMALHKKGDPVKAKQSLRKALELDAGFDGAEEAAEILRSQP